MENRIIVSLILGILLCSCQSNTTSSTESEGSEIEFNRDSIANLIDIKDDTIKYFDSNDPLFGVYAEYLNACAVNSDERILKEYKLNEVYYRWHLIKIESIDGSPIQESIKKELEGITMGDYRGNSIVNGCLMFDYNYEKLNLNELKQTAKQPDSFADNYNEIAIYFEKAYKKLGVQVSFDRINMISTNNHVSNWLSYFSICGFAIIGDSHHCCLVVNKKYVLWYSPFKILTTDYELENSEITMINHLSEFTCPNNDGWVIDTTMEKIATEKTCAMFYDKISVDVDLSSYDHIIVYKEDGNKRYLGDARNIGEPYNVTILPDYNGYHVIYVNYSHGSENSHDGVLIVYSDLKNVNTESCQLRVETSYGICEENDVFGEASCHVMRFDIYKDYTIRVLERSVEGDVDKSITRYYRINDEGKFYEVTGREK
ncbi:MAG: hypothetical protein VZQ98_04850 [Bacteroidales bacterium]|nr:hypothetical protein [Bacteroidales bacterium]